MDRVIERSLLGKLAGGVVGVALAAGLAPSAVAGGLASGASSSAGFVVVSSTPTHTVVLRDGRELTIELIEEDDDRVIANVVVGGISAPQTFAKSDILALTPVDASDFVKKDTMSDVPNRVYVARLPGQFGSDVTKVSLKRIIDDAKSRNATHVVLYCDMDWLQAPFVLDERHDDEHNFESFFQAEQMIPVIAEDVTNPNQSSELPEVYFWVNRAMGGMAFLPMTTRNVFFTSSGAMGGIGDLDSIFEGEEQAFAKKQQGLRRTAVEGWLLSGGHHAEIGKAMMRQGYVLSYRLRNGKVDFLEDYPESDPTGGWTLLTDDGEGDNKDTDAEIVRQQGNDTLTLRADVARRLGFSLGTFDDIEGILEHLGIEESSVVLDDKDDDGFADQADRIFQTYRDGLERARRDYQETQRELAEAETLARRIQKLRELISILDRYPEVLDPQGGLRSNLRLQIEEARNEQRLRGQQDRNRRGTNRRNGGG